MKLKEFKLKNKELFYNVDIPGMIGIAVLDLRISKGLTQTKMARKCKMKQSAIARIETGNTMPSMRTLERIARAMNSELIMRFKNL